jgi:hypothetical protein
VLVEALGLLRDPPATLIVDDATLLAALVFELNDEATQARKLERNA